MDLALLIKMFEKELFPETKGNRDIKNVYVNKEKGIVVTVFNDGSKEVAKCKKGDSFDLEVGIALCVAHKRYGAFNKYISKLKENGSIVDVATKAKAKAKAKK